MTLPLTIGLLVMGMIGYAVGYQHGGDRARAEDPGIAVEVPVPVASPHATVCAQMLEAAWSIEDVTPPGP